MLKIHNLTKKYGNKTAVDNLTLNVEAGQLCAFIGHNGAGKTTTLKAIAGILEYDGKIEINGIDAKTNPLDAKLVTAYLPDNPTVYEHLKGIDYLNFIGDVYKIDSNERQKLIELYSKRLAIYDNLKEPVSSYSHGMKQKLALVSALIHKPKLLLLDEPFVGLDPRSSHEFKEIMHQLTSEGVAIFYSTHVLEVAEKICTHVAIISAGKLVASGTMKEVRGLKSLEKMFLELGDE